MEDVHDCGRMLVSYRKHFVPRVIVGKNTHILYIMTFVESWGGYKLNFRNFVCGFGCGRKLSLLLLMSTVMEAFVEIWEGFFLHQSFFKQFTHNFTQRILSSLGDE